MPLPILTVAQMRDWEQACWASGQTEQEVIRRVGLEVATTATNLCGASTGRGEPPKVLILAGKGHNGDDARAARAQLSHNVRLEQIDVSEPTEQLQVLQRALNAKDRPDLVIDALFGIGLNRPLDASWCRFIEALNTSDVPVLSVDVPSGLNADTGAHFGAAVQAHTTLTVGAPKTGLLSKAGRAFVGRLCVTGDVGLGPCPVESDFQWTQCSDFRNYPPAREADSHKGTYGHVAVLAGSLGFHGAAVLGTHGAQRAQPGLVTLFVPENIFVPVASQLRSAMVSLLNNATRFLAEFSGILLGPGLAAPDTRDRVQPLIRSCWRDATVPVVVDASALDMLPLENAPRNSVRILTPHPGEAARLLRLPTDQLQADRPAALRALSKRYSNAWVVLKGNQTLVGRSTGPVFVNSSGNPHMAQGGSGDLLAGFIAGLFAQPHLAADPLKTLRYAIYEHGAAGDRLQASRSNWMVEDLAVELGNSGR